MQDLAAEGLAAEIAVVVERVSTLVDGTTLRVDVGAAGHGGESLFDRHQALLSGFKVVGIQGRDRPLSVTIGLQQRELFRHNGVHSHFGNLIGGHHRQAEPYNPVVAIGFARLFPGQAQAGDLCICYPGR